MTRSFDRDSWEGRWTEALESHPEAFAARPANVHLRAEAADLDPGLALDAGAGHGGEAIWLASRGWRIEAVDFARVALDRGRAEAEELGAEVADRIEWIEADLTSWTPPAQRFDLVSCLYVQIEGAVADFVGRLASGVAAGGTLLLVGHRPVDPATGERTAAANQNQVSVGDALRTLEHLEGGRWEILVAEDRPRPAEGSGVDAVVRARAPGPAAGRR